MGGLGWAGLMWTRQESVSISPSSLFLRRLFQQEEIAKGQVRALDFLIDKKFPTKKATIQSVAANLFDAESVMSEKM